MFFAEREREIQHNIVMNLLWHLLMKKPTRTKLQSRFADFISSNVFDNKIILMHNVNKIIINTD